jgi:hypothetical protein
MPANVSRRMADRCCHLTSRTWSDRGPHPPGSVLRGHCFTQALALYGWAAGSSSSCVVSAPIGSTGLLIGPREERWRSVASRLAEDGAEMIE